MAVDIMLKQLCSALPAGRVTTDPDVLAGYAHDQAAHAPHHRPAALVRPRNTAEAAQVVRACAEHEVPLVPRGAGTGLSGGANGVAGGIVVSFEAMNAIVDIDPEERIAVVQPGVVNEHLRAACAEHGLWYPPDPASSPWSTIGGNVSTNAGGVCCVKYGVTRDYVLGLEVVTGRGEVVRLGRRTAKSSAGYDLAGLMVGAEGTLGLVTEITLRLRGARPAEQTVVGFFDDLAAAGRAVQAVAAAGVVPSALELVDRFCLRAVDDWKQMGLSQTGAVLLLARCDAPGEAGEREAGAVLGCFESAGATWSALSGDEQEADALFAARRLVYPALERLGTVLTEDVCVPRTEVGGMLRFVEELAASHDVLIASLAHAGDGNLHPMVVVPHGDEAARLRGERAFAEIVDRALAVGGTVTGEHGVGLLKRHGFRQQAGPAVLGLHRAVKAALDPAGILNPGKIFSLEARPGRQLMAERYAAHFPGE